MIHFCPEEFRLLMILVDYVTATYHYYICGFKAKFLGTEPHTLEEHKKPQKDRIQR